MSAGGNDEEIRALEARAAELEKQIYQTDRSIAAEALAAQELFKGVFISDGKKFRWEPTGPGGEYVPKEEPLTDADVQAITDALKREEERLDTEIKARTEEQRLLEAERK